MKRSGSISKTDGPKRATTKLRVRYSETDAMGWVYYGAYLTYFEVGRTELIREIWRSYRELEDDGMRLPVVEVQCRYLVGARYDDLLRIETALSLPSAYRVRFEYKILRDSDGATLARGLSDHCFVGQDGKPIRIPDELNVRAQA